MTRSVAATKVLTQCYAFIFFVFTFLKKTFIGWIACKVDDIGWSHRSSLSWSSVVCAISVDFPFFAKTEKNETSTSRSAALHSQKKKEKMIALTKKMFKRSTSYSLTYILIFTVGKHLIQGIQEYEKGNLRNALSCFTEGTELKCKNDSLNATQIRQSLGEFTWYICFSL